MLLPRRTIDEGYQRYRAPLQQKWRPAILARDRNRCRVCGWGPNAKRRIAVPEPRVRIGEDGNELTGVPEGLEMAHITDCIAFVRAAGGLAHGVTFSFRWDNLVTLCGTCHAVSHSYRWQSEDVALRQRIFAFYEQLRRLRGWSSPFAVLPPHLVPAAMRPARSFHDCMRISPLVPFPTFTKYAADGGLVFAEAERPPPQQSLAFAAGGAAPSEPAPDAGGVRPAAPGAVLAAPAAKGGGRGARKHPAAPSPQAAAGRKAAAPA